MANRGKYIIGIRLLLEKQYLEANASKDRCVKRSELEKYLSDCGYPVEKKTLYSDFAVLGTEFGMQLEYDPHKKGYRLLNPPFEPDELRLLVDCVQASTFITEEEAAAITGKLQRFSSEAGLNRTAVVKDRIHRAADSVVRKADIIHQAMAENKKISFRYFQYTPDRGEHKAYYRADDWGDVFIVSPRRLVWDNGIYYLERYRNDDYWHRQFEVGRMSDIEILPDYRNFKEKQKYAEKPKLPDAIRIMIEGGEEHAVTIRFRNNCIRAVLECFGKDTSIIPVDDHHFKIVSRERCGTEFYSALAQFGSYAKIIAPAVAVEGFQQFIYDLDRLYTEDIEPLYMLSPEEFDEM